MAGRVSSPRFAGRQAELGSLHGAVAQLGATDTTTVLIGGEAGVGKTRLVSEMSGAATAAGARVLTGACVALGAESLPYAPFSQALGELADGLGRAGVRELVGDAGSSGTGSPRARAAPFG